MAHHLIHHLQAEALAPTALQCLCQSGLQGLELGQGNSGAVRKPHPRAPTLLRHMDKGERGRELGGKGEGTLPH